MNLASDFFFFLIRFPQKMGRAKKRPFFSHKTDFPQKWAREEAIFFQRKKRNTDVIFRLGKKIVSPNKNGAAKKKKIGDSKKSGAAKFLFF